MVTHTRSIDGRDEAVAADLAVHDGPHALAKRVCGIVRDRLDLLIANAGIPSPRKSTTTKSRILMRSTPSTPAHPSC
jgi:hypothetical protein